MIRQFAVGSVGEVAAALAMGDRYRRCGPAQGRRSD